jgi:putative SOS response-associated peptidase YedK
MCGRFALYRNLEEIQEAFDIQQVQWEPEPSYNVAPTQDVAVVVQREEGTSLEKMRWGLIPSWAKDPKIGSRMINARSETLGEKPSFKRPFKGQRCLVIADGFFEWAKTEQGKIPMFIRPKFQGPLGFAGLYDDWVSPQGEAITSCTIVTTRPNDFMQTIHNRMPLILSKSQQATWLDPATPHIDEWLSALAPYPSQEMEAYEVSRRVNSPQNNSIECIQPVAGI